MANCGPCNIGMMGDSPNGYCIDITGNYNCKCGSYDSTTGPSVKSSVVVSCSVNGSTYAIDCAGNYTGNGPGNCSTYLGNYVIIPASLIPVMHYSPNPISGTCSSKLTSSSGTRNSNSELTVR